MYQAYWRLDSRPFADAVDPRFFFPGEVYQSALLKLRYAVESRHAAALMAGPAGCGKTLLAKVLQQQLAEQFRPLVNLVFPQMPPDQLLAYLAEELGVAAGAAAGRHALVVIDEAHLLRGSGSLEALRLLLNFEHYGQPCFTLLLVAQSSLLPALARVGDFDSRLGVKCLLRAFSPDETAAYVNHRLAAAGAQRPLFDKEALAALFELSGGLPRRINRLCDLALLVGYAEERERIGRGQIEAVADELLVAAA
jgi:type II secretory pathway predicted ATPase ExeA